VRTPKGMYRLYSSWTEKAHPSAHCIANNQSAAPKTNWAIHMLNTPSESLGGTMLM
jgi:hypothetical protein